MDDRVAQCLLVAKVLVADGMMTDAEKQFLADMMVRLGLTEDERREVVALDGWDEAEALLARMSDDDKRALLDELTNAVLADGKIGKNETETVKQIAEALGVER